MSTNREHLTRLLVLLQRIWTYSLTTKSDDARQFADEIAEASSKGYITTLIAPRPDHHRNTTEGVFGRLWKVTPEGLSFLFSNGDQIAHVEEQAYVAHCAD